MVSLFGSPVYMINLTGFYFEYWAFGRLFSKNLCAAIANGWHFGAGKWAHRSTFVSEIERCHDHAGSSAIAFMRQLHE
jgi:hypothetical protein